MKYMLSYKHTDKCDERCKKENCVVLTIEELLKKCIDNDFTDEDTLYVFYRKGFNFLDLEKINKYVNIHLFKTRNVENNV